MAELLEDADDLGDDQEAASRYDSGVLMPHSAQEAITDNADGTLDVTDFRVFARHWLSPY
jgi:hypothetical protein